MFKYVHTDEANTVTDTLDSAVSLLGAAKLFGPKFLRNWYVSSCSQEASFWKIHFITFHSCLYSSLRVIPQPLGNLCIQVARKCSSLLPSLLCARIWNLHPTANRLRASLQSSYTATACQYNLVFIGFEGGTAMVRMQLRSSVALWGLEIWICPPTSGLWMNCRFFLQRWIGSW